MMDRYLLIGISLVLLWTCLDLQRSYFLPSATENATLISDEDISAIPPPKTKTQVITHVKIQYCLTCGYRNTFEQFSEIVRTHYPNLSIIAENYPPPPLKTFLAKGLSLIKMALLISLLFGQNPCLLLRIPTPRIYLWALQNKMYACLMIFFFSNSMESYLMSTNAFEISVNNIPLWSKLRTGRVPTTDEFIEILQPFTS